MKLRFRTLLISALFAAITNNVLADDCSKAAELSEKASRYASTPREAEKELRKAIVLCPGSASLSYNLAMALYRQEKFQEAEREVKNSLELRPEYPNALNALAVLYIRSERYDEAITTVDKAIRLTPDNEHYRDTRAKAMAYKNPPELSMSAAIKDQNGDGVLEAGEDAFLTVKISNKGSGEAHIADVVPDLLYTVPGISIESDNKKQADTVVIGPNKRRSFEFRIKSSEDKLTDGVAAITISAVEKNEFNVKPVKVAINTRSGVDTPPKTAIKRPDAIAIVVGNKNYKDSKIPVVEYAERDAEVMKLYLTESLGFDEKNIVLLNDAANIDLKKYFGDESDHRGKLYEMIKGGRSDIFIYYSGHGAPDTNTKKAYLVPADADLTSLKFSGYPLETLYKNIAIASEERNPKSITIVLDSCFSGAANSGMLIKNASPLFVETDNPLLSAKNAVVFTSSKGNQISSWYEEKRHSLFTYFFLKAIKNGFEEGKELTVAEIKKVLPDNIKDSALKLYSREQEPVISGNESIVLIPKQ